MLLTLIITADIAPGLISEIQFKSLSFVYFTEYLSINTKNQSFSLGNGRLFYKKFSSRSRSLRIFKKFITFFIFFLLCRKSFSFEESVAKTKNQHKILYKNIVLKIF